MHSLSGASNHDANATNTTMMLGFVFFLHFLGLWVYLKKMKNEHVFHLLSLDDSRFCFLLALFGSLSIFEKNAE